MFCVTLSLSSDNFYRSLQFSSLSLSLAQVRRGNGCRPYFLTFPQTAPPTFPPLTLYAGLSHEICQKHSIRHSPLKQEPGGEAVHGDGEEAFGLRAVDVHRDDLLDPGDLQHPGDKLGGYRLTLVRLLVIAPVIRNSMLVLILTFCFFTSHTELMAAPPLSSAHRQAYTPIK